MQRLLGGENTSSLVMTPRSVRKQWALNTGGNEKMTQEKLTSDTFKEVTGVYLKKQSSYRAIETLGDTIGLKRTQYGDINKTTSESNNDNNVFPLDVLEKRRKDHLNKCSKITLIKSLLTLQRINEFDFEVVDYIPDSSRLNF